MTTAADLALLDAVQPSSSRPADPLNRLARYRQRLLVTEGKNTYTLGGDDLQVIEAAMLALLRSPEPTPEPPKPWRIPRGAELRWGHDVTPEMVADGWTWCDATYHPGHTDPAERSTAPVMGALSDLLVLAWPPEQPTPSRCLGSGETWENGDHCPICGRSGFGNPPYGLVPGHEDHPAGSVGSPS